MKSEKLKMKEFIINFSLLTIHFSFNLVSV